MTGTEGASWEEEALPQRTPRERKRLKPAPPPEPEHEPSASSDEEEPEDDESTHVELNDIVYKFKCAVFAAVLVGACGAAQPWCTHPSRVDWMQTKTIRRTLSCIHVRWKGLNICDAFEMECVECSDLVAQAALGGRLAMRQSLTTMLPQKRPNASSLCFQGVTIWTRR